MHQYFYTIMLLAIMWPQLGYSQCILSCTSPAECKRTFTINDRTLEFYSNFPLDQFNACIKSLIFVVHGTERNAASRFEAVLSAAQDTGVQDHVLIISPFFKTLDDNPKSTDYYWSSSGWKQGNLSQNSGHRISSFAVADQIISYIDQAKIFPFLQYMNVTGHSAGGQYAQMYALTSPIPDLLPLYSYQFLVLNPSNYTYLNELRPYPNRDNYFESPVHLVGSTLKMKSVYQREAGICPYDYNDFKYGLENRNSYAEQLSKTQLINQYLNRFVYYFAGELDNNPEDDSLDTSCEAKLQGPHRLARAKNYYSFLHNYFVTEKHSFEVIPKVGHDAQKMYDSSAIKAVLFNQLHKLAQKK